jgi:RND family efflux transporter MFP subunit
MADEDLSRLRIDKGRVVTRPRGRRKLYYGAALLVFVALAVILYATGLLAPAAEVQIGTVSLVYPSQAFTDLTASGYVVAQRRSSLAAKVTAQLVWLGVEEGSKVRKGQIVAKLESQDAIANREQAVANVQTAKSNLEQTRAELTDADLSLKRAKELVAKGYIAQADYDTALARFRKAEAAGASGQSAINASRAALKSAEVAIEYTLIRAPFDAVVLTKNADVGDIVTPLGAAANAKSAVVTVADLASLQVEVDVSESNLGKIKLGQPCEIQLDALPNIRFPGVTHMIVPTADRTKATVTVKVRFVEKDARVLPEMSAKVAFLSRNPKSGEETPVTAVNKSAAVQKNGQTGVFVVVDDKVSFAPVTPGPQLGEAVEIKSGVKAGDRIVINPPNNLKNGMRVKRSEK